jgi:hypothetical protein
LIIFAVLTASNRCLVVLVVLVFCAHFVQKLKNVFVHNSEDCIMAPTNSHVFFKYLRDMYRMLYHSFNACFLTFPQNASNFAISVSKK